MTKNSNTMIETILKYMEIMFPNKHINICIPGYFYRPISHNISPKIHMLSTFPKLGNDSYEMSNNEMNDMYSLSDGWHKQKYNSENGEVITIYYKLLDARYLASVK